jgi:hypothetical protein
MTTEEKRKLIISELLAAMHQVTVSHNLNDAKWIAAVAMRNASVIATEGRVPSLQESMEWIKKQGESFWN